MIRRGKRAAVLTVCMALLLAAGCSGENKESGGQDKARTETGTKKDTKENTKKDQKQLKQAVNPQFIPNGIRSVSLKKDGDEFLLISREPAEYKMQFDYWEILNPYDENATMNTEVMFGMFQELCSLTFDTPVRIEEGVDTGIADSETGYKVEYVDTVDDSRAKTTEYADTQAEILLGNEDGNGGRYAAVKGNEEEVYVLPDTILQTVFGREPFDYILKIPALISAETIKDVEITADGRKYTVQVDAAADSYRIGKKEVEKKEFAALYQTLSGIGLVSEADGEKTAGNEEPHLRVVFHRNMEDAPDVEVSYYPYDDEFDSVEIGGERRFLVEKEAVEAVKEAVEEAF